MKKSKAKLQAKTLPAQQLLTSIQQEEVQQNVYEDFPPVNEEQRAQFEKVPDWAITNQKKVKRDLPIKSSKEINFNETFKDKYELFNPAENFIVS